MFLTNDEIEDYLDNPFKYNKGVFYIKLRNIDKGISSYLNILANNPNKIVKITKEEKDEEIEIIKCSNTFNTTITLCDVVNMLRNKAFKEANIYSRHNILTGDTLLFKLDTSKYNCPKLNSYDLYLGTTVITNPSLYFKSNLNNYSHIKYIQSMDLNSKDMQVLINYFVIPQDGK